MNARRGMKMDFQSRTRGVSEANITASKSVGHWSTTTLRKKFVNIGIYGAELVRGDS